MNILTRPVSWKTWEFGLIKVGFIFFGMIVGALWPEVFRPIVGPLAAAAIALMIWPVIVWARGLLRSA